MLLNIVPSTLHHSLYTDSIQLMIHSLTNGGTDHFFNLAQLIIGRRDINQLLVHIL